MSGVIGALLWNKTVTLTDTQIKALPSTSITIVPAPGSGLVLLYINGFIRGNFSAGAYTNVVGDGQGYAGQIQYNGANDASSRIPNSFFNGAFDTQGPLPSWLGIDGLQSPPVPWASLLTGSLANQPFQITGFNGVSGNFTGGNAANTLTITIIYAVIEI